MNYMISFYKLKKQAVFILLGIMPLMIFLLVFFPTIKYYELEGLRFMYLDPLNVIISVLAAVGSALVIMYLGNRLLRHAFISMLEGKGLLAFILDSTGLMASFNVKVDAPKMKGEFLQKNAADVEDIYDMDLLQRLIVPRDAIQTKAKVYTTDEKGNITITDEIKEVLVLPEDRNYDNRFSFENRPVLIYNKVMGKFLSRDALGKYEKDIEIKHNALNILSKVLNIDESFKNFGRYIGESIKPKKQGFFGSNAVKLIIIVAIIALIVFVILLFVPGLLSAGSRLSFP